MVNSSRRRPAVSTYLRKAERNTAGRCAPALRAGTRSRYKGAVFWPSTVALGCSLQASSVDWRPGPTARAAWGP